MRPGRLHRLRWRYDSKEGFVPIKVTLTQVQTETLKKLVQEGAVVDPTIPFVVSHKGRVFGVDPEGRLDPLGDIIK